MEKKVKEINKNKHKKYGNVLGHYLYTNFSLVIQQQKHILSPS
jgi:hypothetical protein